MEDENTNQLSSLTKVILVQVFALNHKIQMHSAATSEMYSILTAIQLTGRFSSRLAALTHLINEFNRPAISTEARPKNIQYRHLIVHYTRTDWISGYWSVQVC